MEVDVALRPGAGPATREARPRGRCRCRRRGWRRAGQAEQHGQRESMPLQTEVRPTSMKPPTSADGDGHDPVPLAQPGEPEGGRRPAAVGSRPKTKATAAEEQHLGAEHLALHRVRRCRRSGRSGRSPPRRRAGMPARSRPASRRPADETVPRRRYRTAPKDLKMAPCRMSVPIAAGGLKSKKRMWIGVVRAPPPSPSSKSSPGDETG